MVDQITPVELADRLDDDESVALVDTRQAESFEDWHLHGAENVPFDPREGFDDGHLDAVAEVADDGSVTAICGKGLTSTPFGFELEQHGYEDVAVVKGGMEDWSKVYELVPIDTDTADLALFQLQRRGTGCLGYVVGSRSSGDAVAIDPTRQHHEFALAAAEAGLTIVRVLDTHIHADHLSGGRELAAAMDVPYSLGEAATDREVSYAFDPLEDGDTIRLGEVTIEARHAPGHTSEMLNYLVDDAYLLTGDTLFVESVGRTELQFGDDGAADGAERLYETLHEEILPLPDETTVLPGHVAVTNDSQFESGTPGEPVGRTLGALRDELELLDLEKDEFVDRLVGDAPDKPANYETVIAINTGRESPDTEEDATELEIGPNNCAA